MKNQFILKHTFSDYHPEFEVCEIQEYDRWSINAGQSYRAHLGAFSTLTEAKKAYPNAEEVNNG